MSTTSARFPSGVWPVYGHGWAVELLRRALSARSSVQSSVRLSHAYLLVGASQIGKTALARAFAAALLCSDPAHAPCQQCRACRLMAAGHHPDFRLVQPTIKMDRDLVVERQKGELRAEQAEGLIREVALRPLEGTRKVFLIQDMHQANLAFANRLLKTLEEPPSHAVLLVTARHRNEVLPTIVSRCQIVALHPLDQAVLADALQAGWQVPPDDALLLARLAGGRLGWAVDQFHHPERREERSQDLAALWSLVEAGRLERLRFAGQLATQRDPLRLFGLLEIWSSWWRDVLLAQAQCTDACSNVDQLPRLTAHAHAFEPQAVHEYLGTLQRVEAALRHTANLRLALDVLLVKLPALHRSG